MKKHVILLAVIYLFAITNLVSQIIPMGVYVDIDGKIKYWNAEPNRNGYLQDTVWITFNGETSIIDLRNLRYNHLTLLEAPRARWTLPSNLDPSRMYDTTNHKILDDIDYIHFDNTTITPFPLLDSTPLHPKPLPYPGQEYFWDDITGSRLNNSVVKIVNTILMEYIHQYQDTYVTDNDRSNLRAKLSLPDSTIDKVDYYDYLVDLYVKFNVDKKNRICDVIGYHWDYGVEYVQLKYDKLNRIIYFSHQSIGSIRKEFFFTYDKLGRLFTVQEHYSTVGINSESDHYTHPEITSIKFAYDKSGKMNAQSFLQKKRYMANAIFQHKIMMKENA